MVPVPLSRLQSTRDEAIENWYWFDPEVLLSSRSRQVCMTCIFLRQPPGPTASPDCLPPAPGAVIAPGEDFTRRCSGWTENLGYQPLVDPPSQPNQPREFRDNS